MRQAILKLIFLFICAIKLSGCMLPVVEKEKQDPPEKTAICVPFCETCCKINKKALCTCCYKPPCDPCPSLYWTKDKKPKDCYCSPCDLANAEKKLNDLRCDVEEGCMYSAVILGYLYLYGEVCLPRDINKAICWFQRAADCGITVAMVQMGHFYRDGIGLKRDLNQAFAWYERAARCGDITAMLALGEIYRGFHGTKPNYARAYYWYEQAMNMGSTEGEYQVAWLLSHSAKGERRINEGLCLLAESVDSGNPEAIATYGDLYFEGKIGPRNLDLAREYYEKAAERGSAQGAFKLAMLYSSGLGIAKDPCLATKWFVVAAERGYAPAVMMVGNLYRDGHGVKQNYKQAVVWYQRAASLGIGAAFAELGDLYHAGKGVPRILEEAAKYYQLASDTCKQPYASLMLSVMYELGRGVEVDHAKSVGFYKRAKQEAGFLMAEYKVGRRFRFGFGLPADMERALYWYLLAAKAGLAVAQVELGDLFYAGDGVEKNYTQAYDWYYQAALKGNSYAQNMVGLMWLEDQCPPSGVSLRVARIYKRTNEEKAACWIKKAAFQGARQAQYQLGLMHWQGIGVSRSDVQAYAWIKIAMHDVEDKTPTEISTLFKIMNPEMREQAVRLSEQYRNKYQTRAVLLNPVKISKKVIVGHEEIVKKVKVVHQRPIYEK